MALPEIIDLLAGWPGWSTAFDYPRRQEQSRSASGKVYTKDLGDPLWLATYQTRTLRANEMDFWRARLKTVEAGKRLFGRHLARCYPIAYPNGSWPAGSSFSGVGSLTSIGADRKSIAVSGLPAGFRFSVGDHLRIGPNDLHQVNEPVTVNAAGTTTLFEIGPHLWPLTVAGLAVSVVKPHCLMSIVPGSISATADPATGRGSISFDAMEDR